MAIRAPDGANNHQIQIETLLKIKIQERRHLLEKISGACRVALVQKSLIETFKSNVKIQLEN